MIRKAQITLENKICDLFLKQNVELDGLNFFEIKVNLRCNDMLGKNTQNDSQGIKLENRKKGMKAISHTQLEGKCYIYRN